MLMTESVSNTKYKGPINIMTPGAKASISNIIKAGNKHTERAFKRIKSKKMYVWEHFMQIFEQIISPKTYYSK